MVRGIKGGCVKFFLSVMQFKTEKWKNENVAGA